MSQQQRELPNFDNYENCETKTIEEFGGRGVFVKRDFKKGEKVLLFKGRRIPTSEVKDFTYVLQVGEDEYLDASGEVDDYVNHSCNPNTIIKVEDDYWYYLIALQDLKKGDQIFFDYSTTILLPEDSMECSCGEKTCRKVIRPFYELDKETQDRLLKVGAIPPFVIRFLDKYQQQKSQELQNIH